MIIVGLGGQKGAGKNTAAEGLRAHGFKEASFAAPLKRICSEAFDLPYATLDSAELKDKEFATPVPLYMSTIDKLVSIGRMYGEVGDRAADSFMFVGFRRKFKTPRELLQFVGTDLFRKCVGSYFWVNALNREIQGQSRVVITDMRFPEERQHLRSLGGVLVLVEKNITPTADRHSSENSLGSLNDYDYVIQNEGTEIELQNKLVEIVQKTEGLVLCPRNDKTAPSSNISGEKLES